jgi:hypothetical protein
MDVQLLPWALDGGEWSASCPYHFTPRERAPLASIHWIRGWDLYTYTNEFNLQNIS